MGYESIFRAIGLEDKCAVVGKNVPLSMEALLAKAKGTDIESAWWEFPFPSLNELNKACSEIPQSRVVTKGIEQAFLSVKDILKLILDPITQPLSWMLDGAIYAAIAIPWWIIVPFLVFVTYKLSQSSKITAFVAVCFGFFLFIDHYVPTMETLAIIFVTASISVLFGVPIGIAMSKKNRLEKSIIPVLDMLQTLPTFVYLIPLIFLFDITESKLYGIAIILYAIVPVIRLTNLGIRLVDQDVIEAANAFGMNARQKLFRVELPLALPNIMAGINQTIMMSLAMVVIASLVAAPGLGELVLRGIRSLELGVGIVAGFCIVLIAVILDRVSKAALNRINVTHKTN